MERNILVVDDNVINRTALKCALNRTYNVLEAENGEVALEILTSGNLRISAVLTDVVMPKLDGYGLLENIRKMTAVSQLPVIMVTGSEDETSRVKALEFGANDFLIKPFNPEIIRHCVKNVIALYESDITLRAIQRDRLTGLYNREAFFEKVESLIREQQPGYYVMACFDVENFKYINEEYGTDIGDAVLRHIAINLKDVMPKIGGVCCRYTADRFGVFYPAEYSKSEIVKACHEKVVSPSEITRKLRIRVGRYLIMDTTLTVSSIYDRAAMAEESIRGRYDTYIEEYREEMNAKVVEEQDIVNDMVRALEAGEFEPWFQPQYNHATGAIIGAEALVRWRRNGKFISPAKFVPVFERNGFIYEMDKAIWEAVCVKLKKWTEEGMNPLPVSVNISRVDLFHEECVTVIDDLVKKYGLQRDLLRLEVTESAFSEDSGRILGRVNELINLGFTVEIDDFGSGYSSLNTLKDVPAHILKLDMRFFEKTENQQRGGNIIESVVRMAKWLGMAVIAEGVEEKEQADYLRSIGCYYIQGYYYAKPMPAEEYELRFTGSETEPTLTRLETITTFDNNEFWNPKSMDTLIYNSYVGGASIFEYVDGETELLRVNEQYVKEFNGLIQPGDALNSYSITPFLSSEDRARILGIVEKTIELRQQMSCEVRLSSEKQTEYVKLSFRVIAQSGTRYMFYCVISNLTAQRIAEQKQLESASQLSAILRNINGGVNAVYRDDEGIWHTLFSNSKYYKLFGTRKEDVEEGGFAFPTVVYQEDRASLEEKLQKLLTDKEPVTADFRIKLQNGHTAYLQVNASIMQMEAFGPTIISVIMDVSEKRSLEVQLQTVVQNIYGGVSASVYRNETNKFIVVNDLFFEIHGCNSIEEFEQRDQGNFCFVHPEDVEKVREAFIGERALLDHCRIEYRIIRADGQVRYLRNNISCIQLIGIEEPVHLSVILDITEQVIAEQKEKNATLQIQTIMKNLHGGIVAYRIDDKGEIKILFSNDHYYQMYGYTREQYEEEVAQALDLILPEEREEVMKQVKTLLKEGENRTYEYRCRKRDGSIVWTQVTNTVIHMNDSADNYLIVILTDITALRLAEKERVAATERLRAIMNDMGNGVNAVTVYPDHQELILANDKYFSIHGLTREEDHGYLQKDALFCVYSEDMKKVREFVERRLRDGENQVLEYRVSLPSKELRWVRASVSVTAITGVEAPVQITMYRDITNEIESGELLRFINNSAHDVIGEREATKALQRLLGNLNNYFAGDRAWIIEFDYAKMTMTNTYEVCNSRAPSQLGVIEDFPLNQNSAWFDLLHSDQNLIIHNIDQYKHIKDLYTILKQQGVETLILTPIWRGDTLIGCAGIDNPKRKMDQIDRLRALADYLVFSLNRRRNEIMFENDAKLMKQMIEDIPGGFLRLDIVDNKFTKIHDMNDGFCRMLSMSRAEILKRYATDITKGIAEEDLPELIEKSQEALKNRDQFVTQCRVYGREGLIWMLVVGRFVQDDRGDIHLNMYFSDVSKQKDANEEQAQLLDNLPFGAALYEFDGKHLTSIHLNKQYWNMVGREQTSPEDINVIGAIHEEDRAVVLQELESAIRQGRDYDVNARILFGGTEYRAFHIMANIVPVNAKLYHIYAAFRQVDKEAMSIQEMLPIALSTVMMNSKDLSFIEDKEQRYLSCSESYAKFLGCESARDLIGKTMYDFTDRESARKYELQKLQVMESGTAIVGVSEKHKDLQGKTRIYKYSLYPIHDVYGDVIGIYGTSHDITRQKERESQLELLTNSIPGGLAVFRCSKTSITTTYLNEGLRKLSGYSKGEYGSRSINPIDFVFEEDKPIVYKQLERLLETKEMIDTSVRIHTRNGGYFWVNCKANIDHQEGDEIVVNAVITDITKQQAERDRLHVNEELSRLALEQSGRIIAHYDIQAKTLTMPEKLNPIYEVEKVLIGVPETQIELGRISPETAGQYKKMFRDIAKGSKEGSLIYQQKSTLGWRWIETKYSTVYNEEDIPVYAVLTFLDITKQIEKESVFAKWQNSLQEREADSYTLLRCDLNKGISIGEREGSLLDIHTISKENDFNHILTDFIQSKVYREDAEEFVRKVDVNTLLAEYYRGERKICFEFREIESDYSLRWISLTIEMVEHPSTSNIEAYLMFENIDDTKKKELAVLERSERDPLTSLLNRVAFAERMEKRIQESRTGEVHALLMVDIDRFKAVNDTFGHGAGDQILIEFGTILSSNCRKGDLVGRVGGDEFLIFLPNIGDKKSVESKAEKICELTRRNINSEIRISSSIGIAMFPKNGLDCETLYNVADSAMYKVKEAGKDSFAFETDVKVSNLENRKKTVRKFNMVKEAPKKPRMLIIDDNRMDQVLLAGIFKDKYQVIAAMNGTTALAELHHYGTSISVVLLDLMMPQMNGFEVLEHMRTDPLLKQVPVIVVSADEELETCIHAIRQGASDFVTKPVDTELLKIRVQSAVTKTENERLRVLNASLENQTEEVVCYQTVLERTGTFVVSLDWGRTQFSYSPSITNYISGRYDDRSLWHIFLSDDVAKSMSVQKLQQLVHEIANDRSKMESRMEISLRKAGGKMGNFEVNLYKTVTDYGLTDKIILAFQEVTDKTDEV